MEKTVNIKLTKEELTHLINDTISYIYGIKRKVFNENWNFGTEISEVEVLTSEQKEKLISYGYYSRKELLDKLEKIRYYNFQELTCCGK